VDDPIRNSSVLVLPQNHAPRCAYRSTAVARRAATKPSRMRLPHVQGRAPPRRSRLDRQRHGPNRGDSSHARGAPLGVRLPWPDASAHAFARRKLRYALDVVIYSCDAVRAQLASTRLRSTRPAASSQGTREWSSRRESCQYQGKRDASGQSNTACTRNIRPQLAGIGERVVSAHRITRLVGAHHAAQRQHRGRGWNRASIHCLQPLGIL